MPFNQRTEIYNTLHNQVFLFIILLASYIPDTQTRNSNAVSGLTLIFKQQFKRDVKNPPPEYLYDEKLF